VTVTKKCEQSYTCYQYQHYIVIILWSTHIYRRQNAGVKSGAADWKDTANVVICEAWAENSDY